MDNPGAQKSKIPTSEVDVKKDAMNKLFESLVAEFMFKQWGVEWDIGLLFSNYIKGEIDHEVTLLSSRLG